MINAEKVIQLALKAGARMVYVWGEPPKVENMDIMEYTKFLIEEALNEQTDAGSRLAVSGDSDDTDPAEGSSISDEPEQSGESVQPRPRGRKKAAKEIGESVQEGT